MSEDKMTEDKVRTETMRQVNPGAHWAYLAAVLGGGIVLMILFIALLGAGGG